LRILKGVALQLVREHPSLLLDIPLSARLGFPDVVFPCVKRNDIYIKLWSATFTPSPQSSGGSIRIRKFGMPTNFGNVQVTLEVRKPDGTIIPDVLFAGGSGEPPVQQYHSLVFTHTERPTFGELLKISLPSQHTECHLFLTFRSRGKDRQNTSGSHELEKPFAFAYLPLISPTSCIKDGSHNLVLYRPEKNLQPGPNLYFDAPAVASGEPTLSNSLARSMTPLRDRVSLRSYLCSTTHSQDDTLRSLFAWQTLTDKPDALASTLQLFGFVSEEEIAKFVPAVLDSLLGILTSNVGDRQDETDDLVFRSLIKVLAMTADRRFPNFKEVLTVYVDRHFNHPASSFRLLRSMKHVMSDPGSQEYRSFLKVWHLFFRFIIRSRELDRARGVGLDATTAHIEADFKRQVKAVLSDINTLMKSTDKGLIGSQTLVVQHYPDILPDLAQVFQAVEIAEMIINFADTLTHVNGSIAIYKLLLLLQVVRSIFDEADSRALLIPAIIRWVKPHLGRYDEGMQADRGEGQSGRDAKRVKWLECNRLAMTVRDRRIQAYRSSR
jgi:dedicator of cytokinesis protein 3